MKQIDDKRISKAAFIDTSTKEVIIEAYLIPKSLSKFPSFYGSKQAGADCPELFFRRISRADEGRVKDIMDRLRQGKSVITVGLPGIGKSTEMNYILMKFLQNIGIEGWPKIVLLRMKFNLYEFNLKNGQPRVSVKYMKDLDGDLLQYINTFEDYSIDEKPVFLCELEENEADPKFDCIATLINIWRKNIL